jgi:hypothetical protein
LWQDHERVFRRGWRAAADGKRSAVLVVVPATEQRTGDGLDRLAHEYGLKGELEGAWALRPLDLTREAGRTVLVLEDAGGEPLEALVGAPMQVRRFLHLAIGIAAALGKLHQRGFPEIIEFARGEIPRSGVQVKTALADRLPHIRGDRVQSSKWCSI